MSAAGKPLLVVERLGVTLAQGERGVTAVDDVSLSLARGRTLAIVGESGCGKSTLCRAIKDLLPRGARVRGRIALAGQDLGALAPQERRVLLGRQIGLVLQDPLAALNPVMKVGWQVAEPLRFHFGLARAAARERAIALLAAVGIAQPAALFGAHPHELSGGMRQRVVIAIALACEPPLLLADEPTTALDVTVQAEILGLLTRLQRERNMAMLLVSHNLGVVAGLAHETAVMYAGRIVEQAPTAALFRRLRMPYTRALFEANPRLDEASCRSIQAIGGQPPDLAALPPGCAFAPRCRVAQERCCRELPPLLDDGCGHRCACWFALPGEVGP